MLGSKAAVTAEAEKIEKAKEFDRWSDDETPEVANEAKEREFDAWSEASEEAEENADADAPFFTDAEPDFSLVDLGVSSKHSAPHPGEAPAEVPVRRLAPKPPKAPPPSHLLKAAELPIPPPPASRPPMTVPGLPIRPIRPIVQPVPVVLVPVSTAWSCFFSLQHGAERMKLFATVVLGDPSSAQALIQAANANLKLSHRSHFDDVKKAAGNQALKVVLQLVPMTDQKDQQARDSLESYLLSKDRAGVVRVGNRDLYLIPPSKAEDCGLKVRPPVKSLVAAVTEKHRSKKTKQSAQSAEAKKKVAEVLVADDTEDSEEAKDDKKEEVQLQSADDRKEGDVVPEVQEEDKKEELIADSEDKEDNAVVLEDQAKEEEESKASQEAAEVEDSPEQREQKKVPHVWPPSQAKPRFTREDVEQAAFELQRSRRTVRAPPAPFPEPWWNPYACPPGEFGQQEPEPERRRKRHRSSKEHGRRTRRRSKSKDSSSSHSSAQPSSGRAEATQFQNPYIDPVPETTEVKENPESNSTDDKWKGLLARVEALAQFCRDGNEAPV